MSIHQVTHINASVKIDISAVLVSATEPVLGAKWVTLLRTKIVHLDYDAITSIVKTSARAVSLDGKSPAGPACWALAIALISIDDQPRLLQVVMLVFLTYRPSSVQVLRHGCREAWLGVEEAGRGIGVAIWAAESVSRTVLGEGCLVAHTATAIRAAWGRGWTGCGRLLRSSTYHRVS